MFRRRKTSASAAQQKQRRIIVLRDTLNLVRVANDAELESTRSGSLESTTPQELARSRAVRHAQRLLVEHLVRGFESGLTLEDLTSEIIDPVVDESLVGDVARFAIDEALRSASEKASPR